MISSPRRATIHLLFLVISPFESGRAAEDWKLYDTAEMRRQLEGGEPVVA